MWIIWEQRGAGRIWGGQAATKAIAAALEGGQKLSTQYEGAAEERPFNYVLIFIGGEVGADNNGGDGGGSNVGRGDRSSSVSV